jgi:CheY-like chemotaxis protein
MSAYAAARNDGEISRARARQSWPPVVAAHRDPRDANHDRDGARPYERAEERGPAILVVEDDFVVAMELETALKAAGFQVIGLASSAREAIELARETCPALAVMDIRLNGAGDGVDAALELYNSLGVRSIFATAHQDSAVRARAQAALPLGWLPKPYDTDVLVEMARRAIAALKS